MGILPVSMVLWGCWGPALVTAPPNKLNRPSSPQDLLHLLTCAQTRPIVGRREQERILQDEAPASGPNLHTPLFSNPKKHVAQSWLSQNQQLSFSSATPAPLGAAAASLTAVTITKATGTCFHYLISAWEPPASGCPLSTGTSLLPEQRFCCSGVAGSLKAGGVGPLQCLNIAKNQNLAFL